MSDDYEAPPEPAHRKLYRIEGELNDGRALSLLDCKFLFEAHELRRHQLNQQQQAVSDAAERWRQIGYEEGYAAGYDKAAEDCPVCRDQVDG